MKAKLLFFIGLCIKLSFLSAQDTTAVAIDTVANDSILHLSLGVPVSKDSLDATVNYNAKDSMKIDATGKKLHLYGDAFVSYTTITLRAAHIELDWSQNIVTAEGMMNDTTGVIEGLPAFADGDNTFTADRIRYNFNTRKGIVYDAVSSQDDVVIHGTKSKFISADPADSTAHDIIYSQDAIFTTCTADHPHFGIRSKKQKIIPGKRVVIGPSNLEIMGVPTPLWLPFGFFPISEGRSTGLLFPKDYEYSELLGFGLKNIGWFFPLGDNFNLTLLGDYYIQGTYALGVQLQYKKRYKHNGSFNLKYDSRKTEQIIAVLGNNGEPQIGPDGNPVQEAIFNRQNGFSVRWSHQQDRAAHPMNKLGGTISFETNNFSRRVFNDARSVNNNTNNSNFSFSRIWQDKPISMSIAFGHSQNNRTRMMTVDFPTFNFQTQTLYPFRKKERLGQKKWFEDITLRYDYVAKATLVAPDTTFFEKTTLDNARYGMKHNVSTGTSIKLLKYFNLNPTINYTEVWYPGKINATFIEDGSLKIDTVALPGNEVRYDTLDYGTYRLDTLSALSAQRGYADFSYRTFSAGVSLNTQIFGTVRFKKGPIRGLRHVIKPSMSMSYQPNYQTNENYYNYIQDSLAFRDSLTFRDSFYFSTFREGIYGAPPNSKQQFSLNYSIINIFEAKIFSRKDSTERNVKLFENIYIKGGYNFAADSLKWSPIALSGNQRFFKGASTFFFNATFDPLIREQTSATSFKRVDRTTWAEHKKPFEFVDATFRLTTNLTIAKIRALFQGEEEAVVDQVDTRGNAPKRVEEVDFLSLFENFSIRHNLAFSLRPLTEERDTFSTTTHSLELRGSLGLTPNWNVDIGSIGYDFVSKRTTYPYLGLRRDLHCWEMGFTWAPTRNTYSFYLRVKPGTLDFLSVPYQRNNVDGADPFR